MTREPARLQTVEILNLVDDALTALARKGNLDYAEQLYNPMRGFRRVHHISFLPDDAQVRLSEPSIQVHVLKTTRRWLPGLWVAVDFVLCTFQIIAIAIRYHVRLIRGRGPHYASFFGWMASKLLRVPLVVSVGGNHRLARRLTQSYPVFKNRRIDEWVEARVLRGADRVLCPNEYSRRYVMSIGVRADRAVLVPLRLRQTLFAKPPVPPSDSLKCWGIPPGSPVVLFVGRLERDKQVDVLIESAPWIHQKISAAHFLFVGGGSLEGELKRRARVLGIAEFIHWAGFQPSDVVQSCLWQADVVWIPMSGFVIHEAAAAGRAIVAFDVEWHSEFIVDGQTGLLARDRDARDMADQVVRLLQDLPLRQKLGAAARAKLEADYDPQRVAQRELEVLREVLEKKCKV